MRGGRSWARKIRTGAAFGNKNAGGRKSPVEKTEVRHDRCAASHRDGSGRDAADAEPPGQAQRLQRRARRGPHRRARLGRRGERRCARCCSPAPVAPSAPDRISATRDPRKDGGPAGPRAHAGESVYKPHRQANSARWRSRSCARSTASPPGPARTSPSPATTIVLAARSAKFIQAFAKIGLVPEFRRHPGSCQRLVGEARAKALALTAEADRCADRGLLGADLEGARRRRPDARGRGSWRRGSPPGRPFGLGLTKRAIQAAAGQGARRAARPRARPCSAEAGRTPDYAEGVTAFLEEAQAGLSGGHDEQTIWTLERSRKPAPAPCGPTDRASQSLGMEIGARRAGRGDACR